MRGRDFADKHAAGRMGFFYEARATECGRIGQVWLEGRRAAMDAAMFRQEFMGEFVDDGV